MEHQPLRGGKVITASANGSINGVKIALENDLIFCPACKSQGKINCVGPRIPERWNGIPVALENDLCLCGCPVPPKLIPNQTLRCQVIADVPLSTPASSSVQGEVPVRISEPSDSTEIIEQVFSLRDENDQPVEGFRYDLYRDGAIHTKAADYLNGDTVAIRVYDKVSLVTWFNIDGASHHG